MYIWSNYFFFFFKQKTAYEMRISDWSSDVCSSDLSIHAGLWTSAALNAPPQNVPVLRTRLTALEAKFGFDPQGHTGQALTYALTQFPFDLVTAFTPDLLETLALTSMSLAHRPRPRLLVVPSTLGRHMFAFVSLPRAALST